MKIELVKTGISGLDTILGGGIPKGSVVTLSGPTGSGKSTFGMQFLIEGAKKGEPGLYIAIEETRQTTYAAMSGYGWDLEQLEKEKKFMLLDYPVYEVDQFLTQNSAIAGIVNKMGIKRIVIDSIMPVALRFKDEDERKKGFLKFIDIVRSWGAVTLIISEDTPASTQDVMPDTRYGVETFTNGWIHIYYMYSPKSQERRRAVEVLKMKGIKHSSRIYEAELGKNGFEIKSK